MTNPATQCVVFPELLDRPVFGRFDEPATSVDGGAVQEAALLVVPDRVDADSGATRELSD